PSLHTPRALHSFPTRRSSDLSVASGVMNVNVGFSRAVWEDFIAAMLQDMRRTSRRGFSVNFMSDVVAASEAPDNSPATRLYRTRDRKSTRLNSSHVAISYAVF